MKKKIAFLFALIACLMFATNAMATWPSYSGDGSADVKAYGDVTAEYGQGTSYSNSHELGCIQTKTNTVSGEASGMGALNTVGKCGTMGVLDGEFSFTTKESTANAAYTISTTGTSMTGANDMTGVAGVSFCAQGNADAYGNVGVAQTLQQSQFGNGGCQTYTGGVTINTGVGN